jgi:rhomboid protease GluP
MPEKSQTIAVNGYDAATLTAIAYGTLEQLKWNIKYAGENIIVAYTPKSFNRWDMEITVQATGNQITVNSKMIHGEAFDMMDRNQKNINQFAAAYENVKPTADEQSIQTWNEKIAALQQDTVKVAVEEVKQAEEIDKVMNLSSGNLYVTYGIIGINVLVFIGMVATGIDFFSPPPLEVLKWGGNLSALTLSGEWWRLLTAMFLHFGILHLGLNMYALYMSAVYLEPMLGKARYTTAYICTGLLASLVSTMWLKNDFTVAAGASGAVFGMYGVFLALLTTNIIPKQLRNAMLQSTLIFVAYNVFYGFKPGSGIDNAAHLGGLISGMVIGYIFYWGMKNQEKVKSGVLYSIIALATAAALYFVLTNEKRGPVKVDYKSGQIFTSGENMFEQKMMEFGLLEIKATAPESDSTITDLVRLERTKNETIPAWKEAKKLLEEMDTTTFTEIEITKLAKLKEYVNMRISLTDLRIKSAEENTDKYDNEIIDLVDKINKQVASIDEK